MSLLTDASTRRSEDELQNARLRDEEYRRHAATLDRYLAATFGTALSRDEREGVRQQAFVGLASEISKGVEVHNTEAMLITCARNAAYGILRSADRRRRKTFDPHDSREARLSDPADPPLDHAIVTADEDRRVRMLMSQLDERSRRALQLRVEFGLDMKEIAERLDLSLGHAYKLVTSAGTALAASIAANDDGAHSRQQRALLTACVMGTASDEERHQAETVLEGDAHARALLAEIRGQAHRAAALMPPIAVAAEPSSGRVSHMIASIKQYVGDLAGRGAPAQDAASQVAASGGLRGATPGAVAALCAAGLIGGGTVAVNECIQAGGPVALVDKLRGQPRPEPEPAKAVVEAPIAPVVEQLTTTPEQVVSPPPEPTPDPEPDAEAASEPAPAPATGSDSVSGLTGSPAAAPTPAPPPPPAVSGGGGGGSSSATFGGL